ncbi:putative leucine-rich repeat-containing protein DDB_G0290503 [Montipora foliosa]|uniref:putative leucine-rich repeat-containing protein DDB_G0290503 n=1 Tax=Montipora foliosa TaxID=591990 RepID=UPI0035F20374
METCNGMMSSESTPKQIYDDLKGQLSRVNKTLKNLEMRAFKPNFSTDELSSKSRKTPAFKVHKIGERDLNDEVDVKNIRDGKAKLERDLETLKGIQTQKNSRKSKIEGAALGKRRKSKKCIPFRKLEKDISDYQSLIGDILAEVESVNLARRFGAVALEEGQIPKNKEEKTRQDLVAFISRWNALSEEVFKASFSIDALVSEVQTEYSKLNLWYENSEVADSLLMEYDSCADKPEKLGTTIRAVRLQLHENQNVLENFRKAKPRLQNMRDTAVALMKCGRLEETDADELECVINILVAKYESIDNRLNASRDRIYAEINKLRKRMVKQRSSSILRRFSSKRTSSFRRKRSLRKKLEIQQRKEMAIRNLQAKKDSEVVSSPTSMDLNGLMTPAHPPMKTDKEYEEEKSRLANQRDAYQRFDLTLKACEKTIYDLNLKSSWRLLAPLSITELEKQLDQLMTFEADLNNSRAEFQTEKENFEKRKEEDYFDETDEGMLERRVNSLHSSWEKLWGDFIAKKNKLQKQKDAFESFNCSFKAWEKTVADLDSESLQKFPAVGPNGDELRRQLGDINRFESELEKSRSDFQSEVERFQKAKEEGLFFNTHREALEKIVRDLESRWDELWREHVENKNRILQATSAQNHKSIQSITNDLDKIEKQINTPEIYDEERVYLEENIFKQKRLMEDLHTYDHPIDEIRNTTKIWMENEQMESQTYITIQRKTEELCEKQIQLRKVCQENESRLVQELTLLDQRRDETVRVSDDYSTLSQTLDEFLADEGFAELDSSKSSLEMKISDFDIKIQSISHWMTDTEKLVNSLHVRMAPGEVTKRVQQIKKRWGNMDRKEVEMKDINCLGQDITNEPVNMETKHSIEDELEALNTKWRKTKEMLREVVDTKGEEAPGYRGCWCFQMVPRAFHACFYS